MKSRGRLFNVRMFAEGFGRLKRIGLFGLGLTAVMTYFERYSRLIPVASAYPYAHYSEAMAGELQVSRPSELLLYLVLIPAMMLTLFRFYDNRPAGDFYDALPQRRITLYLSYGGAVFAWTAILAMTPWLLETPWYMITHGVGIGNVWNQTVEVDILQTLAGGLLSMGAMTVAMGLTGTPFAGVVAFLLILLGPRLILTLMIWNYSEMVPWASLNEQTLKLLDYRYQVVFGKVSLSFLSSSFLWEEASEKYEIVYWLAPVYSSVLGFLYLILGGVLHVRRKSEAAGRPGVSRGMNIVLRVSGAFVFTFVGTIVLARRLLHESWAGLPVFLMAVFFGLGLVFFFLYGYVAFRQTGERKKGVGQLAALVLLNGAVCVLFVTAASGAVARCPSAEKIKTVTIPDKETLLYSMDVNAPTEVLDQTGPATSASEAVRQMVAESLEKEAEVFQKSEADYKEFKYSSKMELEMDICYEEKGKEETIRRRICMDELTWKKVGQAFLEEIGSRQADIKLPELPDGDWIWSNSCGWDFQKEDTRKLYDCLSAELKETKAPVFAYLGEEYNRDHVFDFLVSRDTFLRLPVSVSTPKTVELLAKMGNEHWNLFDLPAFAAAVSKEDYSFYASLSFILYTADEEQKLHGNEYVKNGGEEETALPMPEPETLQALCELLRGHEEKEVTMGQNILFLNYYYDNINLIKPVGHWYNLTDEEVEALRGILNCDPVYHRSDHMTEIVNNHL